MNSKEILQEAFESDKATLKRALDSDKKLLDLATGWAVGSLTKLGILVDILVSKDILTIDDAKLIFKQEEEEIENEC